MTAPSFNIDDIDLPPNTLRELGPKRPTLFLPMHREAALRCQSEGLLLPTRELLADPAYIPLGDPRLVRTRLTTVMPKPWPGRVGDYTALSYTPRTAAALGSCGARPAPGARPLRADDLVVATVPLDKLFTAGLLVLFSDKNPCVRDVRLGRELDLENLPWHLFRTSRFGGADVDPAEKARYHSEILVWGAIPMNLVTLNVVDMRLPRFDGHR